MEVTGFASPRTDTFPAGLRVLVVDDDPTWLKILEKMLKKCSYEVTTCGLAREALDLLRERKDGFDIVVSDVNMPDLDGFKLLEHVGLEMDLPVIMMSVDGETSRVMKGVQHGACDYLLKPIRMKELRNIWQHVFRKRIHEVKELENHEGLEEIQFMRNAYDQSEERHFPSGSDLTSGKKRKDPENRHDDRECYDSSSSVKKTRVVWTIDLHQKFVKAVNQIGYDKVGPKKILDLMGVPWLTRENVASHLQKYRLYLSRLQKEKESTVSFGGMKHSDVSSKEHTGNHCLQNSVNMQQTKGSCDISGNKTIMQQNIDFKSHKADMKCTVTMPIAEPNNALNGDNPDSQRGTISRMAPNLSFKQLDLDVKYAVTIPKQYTWDAEGSEVQTNQECKQHFQPKSGFNHLPLPRLHQNVQFDGVKTSPSFDPKPSNMHSDKPEREMTPVFLKHGSQGVGESSPGGNIVDLFSVQPESELGDSQALKPNPSILWSSKSHSSDQIFVSDLESAQRSLSLGSGPDLGSWDENQQGGPFEGDFHPINGGLENIESFNYNDPGLISEVPSYLYDSLKFDYELPLDSMEYPVVDQGLFII